MKTRTRHVSFYRKVLPLLFVVALFMALPLTLLAAPPLLVDEADLLTDAEEARLLPQLTELSDTYDIDVAVVTVPSLNGAGAEAYADDYFDYNGYGRGGDDSGVLFLQCPEERDYHITTHGRCAEALSDDAISEIKNAVVPYLRDDDYISAYEAYVAGVDNYMLYMRNYGVSFSYTDVETHEEDQQYLLTEPEEEKSFFETLQEKALGNAALASIAGFLISFLYMGGQKGKLVSVRKQSGAASYVKAGESRLRVSRDILVNRTVSKTPIARNDDTPSRSGQRVGGHSTMHTSSSGRSHGGGGGKY